MSFVANGYAATFMAKPQFFIRLKQEIHGVGSFTTTLRKDEIQINIMRALKIDPTDAKQLSKIDVEGVKQVMVFLGLFKKYVLDFEYCYLNDMTTIIGVRESRRIIGEYILTEEGVKMVRGLMIL